MKNYSTFTNNFTYGRDLVKKLVIAAARHDAVGVQAALTELRALPVRLSPRALRAIRYWGGAADE